MEVSVESLEGLKRRITVLIPSEQVEEKVSSELKKLAGRVQLDGFRPGKAPLKIVKQRYSDSVRLDVAQDILKDTLDDAFTQEKITPINTPEIDVFDIAPHKDFRYSVTFEVYPEFTLQDLDKKASVEVIKSSVTDEDVDQMIEKLRSQNRVWTEVTRAAKEGDKAKIDFIGYVEDKPFQGGDAKGFETELGSHQMIPGFEEGIVGHNPGEEFSIEVTFPEDYQEKTLAGKPARFDITLHTVQEGTLPELDKDFAKKFGVKSGDVNVLKTDIRAHMERELDKRLREVNHEACFGELAKQNVFDLPVSLVDKEIANLKHEFFHQIYGAHHSEDEKIPDFPRELFEARAQKRVHLGLVVSEYVKKHRLVVEQARVDAMLERFSTAYDNPEEFIAQSKKDTEWMAEIEAIVMEQMIAEHILDTATVKEKKLAYDEAMSYRQSQDNQKE